jgi:hypothetical protein
MFPPDSEPRGRPTAVPQSDGPPFLDPAFHGGLPSPSVRRASYYRGQDGELSINSAPVASGERFPPDADCEIAKADAAANGVISPFDCLSFGTITICLPLRIDATPCPA